MITSLTKYGEGAKTFESCTYQTDKQIQRINIVRGIYRRGTTKDNVLFPYIYGYSVDDKS